MTTKKKCTVHLGPKGRNKTLHLRSIYERKIKAEFGDSITGKNRQSSYYLSQGIVNQRTVLLERQSIIREKIVSSDRRKKVALREQLDGEFEHFISSEDLFGLYCIYFVVL